MLPIGLLLLYYKIEEIQNCRHTIYHDILKDFAEEEDEHIDDNETILFHSGEEITEAVGGDGVEDAGAVERWNGDKVKNHEAEIDNHELRKDKLESFAVGAMNAAGIITD